MLRRPNRGPTYSHLRQMIFWTEGLCRLLGMADARIPCARLACRGPDANAITEAPLNWLFDSNLPSGPDTVAGSRN
jgi:hypothetical protein